MCVQGGESFKSVYKMHSIILFSVSFLTICALEEDPMTTYFKLYELGAQYYREKNFTVANSLFEKAVEDYHFYHENVINCRLECRRKNSSLVDKLASSGDVLDILEIRIYESFISQSKCLKRCFKRIFGDRPDLIPSADTRRIDKDFDVGRQYQFIQFCQYEVRGNDRKKCVFKGNNSFYSSYCMIFLCFCGTYLFVKGSYKKHLILLNL
jgi:hypothetical protein